MDGYGSTCRLKDSLPAERIRNLAVVVTVRIWEISGQESCVLTRRIEHLLADDVVACCEVASWLGTRHAKMLEGDHRAAPNGRTFHGRERSGVQTNGNRLGLGSEEFHSEMVQEEALIASRRWRGDARCRRHDGDDEAIRTRGHVWTAEETTRVRFLV
jgi:hypothetical protein